MTLASYAKFFGEDPPADIWPAAETRRQAKHDFVRVDRERSWVIPRPGLSIEPKFGGAIVLVGVVVCCSGAMLAQTANVFDWRGPDFLVFYMVLYAAFLGAALWLRHRLRQSGDAAEAISLPPLDGYSAAFLNGGRVLAVNTAIVSLASRKAVSISKTGRTITSLVPEPEFTHPLEKAVYRAAEGASGNSLSNVRDSVLGTESAIVQSLQAQGLLMDAGTAAHAVWLPLIVALAPVAAGIVKIIIGLNRDKPVSFLVLMCIASIFISLLACARRPRRTRKGDAVLSLLRSRHAGPRRFDPIRLGASPAEITLLIGLFGMSALAGTEFDSLRMALKPPGNSGDGIWSSSCGSSCGGGGGSSCGGGGGGGGCGGCGGH